MPVVGIPVDILRERLGEDLPPETLVAHLHALGCDVEGFADLRRFRCDRCGNILEITETEAEPTSCDRCGADFTSDAERRVALGTTRVIRMELLADRPDIFDPGGLARALRGYLGLPEGSPDYPLEASRIAVEVDPALARPESYRPFIACGVIRGLELDDDRIKVLMKLQENLHWAMGRDRKRASIGVYDLSTLEGQTFRYRAARPDEPRFVPLGFPPDREESRLSPAEVLELHPKGLAYGHLLKGWPRFPLLEDGRGGVMALIPVINSEQTRVHAGTRDVFIDVTGPESRLVGRALNVLFTSLLELTPGAVGERVRVVGIDGEEETPDLGRQRVDLAVGEASRVLGPPVDPDQEPALLERMGHRVSRDGERLAVDVPAWRNDVLHARDLVEDVAIAFGYDNLDLGLVETQTVGEARPVEEAAGLARSVMTGLGHLEVMTLPLVSESSAYSALRLTPDEGRVVLANPISTEQTMLRTSLLQGLLATFALNASHEMPQRIFEVGAVTRLAEDAETGAEERRLVAAGVIGPQVGFAAIRTVAEAFLGEFGLGIDVRPMDSGLFLAGRGAYLLATGPDGPLEVGLMGEVHPEVLENLKLVQPAAVLELDLEITAGLA